jgi:hypothetical protein
MTNSEKLNNWLQVAGMFGVLGGLIFVGLQLAQDRQIAATGTIADAADRRMYWAELIGQNLEAWARGLAGEELSAEEAIVFDALATSWELAHYSYYYNSNELSVSPKARFVREWALELDTHPGLLEWWRAYRRRMDYTSPIDISGWPVLVEEELSRLEDARPKVLADKERREDVQ